MIEILLNRRWTLLVVGVSLALSSQLSHAEGAEVVQEKDSRVPQYTLIRPSWGVQLTGSWNALGGGGISDHPVRAGQLAVSYQPPFVQKLGVLSLGLTAGMNLVSSYAGITPKVWSLWQVGADARYQMRYFREQPIVPFGGFEFQSMAYSFEGGASGRLSLNGPVYGALVLMNFLEPDAAAEFYIRQGVSRTYLVAEVKDLSGADSAVSFSGRSYFFGLRFEF